MLHGKCASPVTHTAPHVPPVVCWCALAAFGRGCEWAGMISGASSRPWGEASLHIMPLRAQQRGGSPQFAFNVTRNMGSTRSADAPPKGTHLRLVSANPTLVMLPPCASASSLPHTSGSSRIRGSGTSAQLLFHLLSEQVGAKHCKPAGRARPRSSSAGQLVGLAGWVGGG